MAFRLYKNITSTCPAEEYLPTEAVGKGELVKLVAAASAGAVRGRVTRIAGGQDNALADCPYGVTLHAVTAAEVTAGQTVMVLPITPEQIWIADSAADTDARVINVDTGLFLAAKGTAGATGSYAVTAGGTISLGGSLVYVVGVLGAVADRKYLVKFKRLRLVGGLTFTT
jgi:hypothetical protein